MVHTPFHAFAYATDPEFRRLDLNEADPEIMEGVKKALRQLTKSSEECTAVSELLTACSALSLLRSACCVLCAFNLLRALRALLCSFCRARSACSAPKSSLCSYFIAPPSYCCVAYCCV